MFDPVLLKTFVAVAETLSFTRSAELLGISQPTVSQQVRRLEKAAGRVLVARDTRDVRLTDNGDAMVGFARSILAAHDEAAAYFTGSAMKGRLRFGSADDLALTQLPLILRDFRQLYPHINLELTVNQSGVLSRRLAAGQLDLVFVKQEPGASDGRVVRRERLVWAAHKAMSLDAAATVPLIAYQAPSMSRAAAIRALEDAGRTWRITCNTREVNGVIAAARAGIGIAVFPQTMVPPDLVDVTNAFDLPALGEVEFALLANAATARAPVDTLISAILGRPSSLTPAG
ncbi:LysR substrate-binding domain-containing protein [Marisediminicola senii]|uniref:LysR substrate-binding domain-containing protein n=1 Tax=Marisediminicola senii TaxID=2711233 RepID=UPI0013EAA4B7|nr:LysR substrate-binding domain-containing protein [Marisediminicola senii]